MITDDMIKKMVDSFLCWKLPSSFNPDGGINYIKNVNHNPTGTNLFSAVEAELMVLNMLEAINEEPKYKLAEHAVSNIIAANSIKLETWVPTTSFKFINYLLCQLFVEHYSGSQKWEPVPMEYTE